VPLALSGADGKRLTKAEGKNPNPFFTLPDIPKPLISEKAKLTLQKSPPVWEYDVQTEAGKEYLFTAE
jgi:alpha-L-fucosidase 2